VKQAAGWLTEKVHRLGVDERLTRSPDLTLLLQAESLSLGIEGKLARPFVGVIAAYLNRSSPNQDLTKVFLERYLLTDDGLRAINRAAPIGVPNCLRTFRYSTVNS